MTDSILQQAGTSRRLGEAKERSQSCSLTLALIRCTLLALRADRGGKWEKRGYRKDLGHATFRRRSQAEEQPGRLAYGVL